MEIADRTYGTVMLLLFYRLDKFELHQSPW